jgi:outer membrane protein
MKYAIVRIDVVAGLSNEGKALQARAQAAQEQKAKELNDKNRQLQAVTEKLEKTGSVMSDQARAQSQQEIERLQRDIQRFSEDAQAELQSLTQQLQLEFEKKLVPVIDQVARAKGVHFVYNFNDGGFIWVDPGIDLTGDIITAAGRPSVHNPLPPRPHLLPFPRPAHRSGDRA